MYKSINDAHTALVDVNGEPVDNPATLGSILEAARAAVVNL